MYQRKRIIIMCICVMLAGDITLGEQTKRLNISTTIPPRLCTYPERCDPVGPSVITKGTVANGIIRYVGSRLSVTYTDDLISIVF